jgi:hypothetical protein
MKRSENRLQSGRFFYGSLCLKKSCLANDDDVVVVDDDNNNNFYSCDLLHKVRAVEVNYSYAENSKMKLFTFLCSLRIRANLNYVT